MKKLFLITAATISVLVGACSESVSQEEAKSLRAENESLKVVNSSLEAEKKSTEESTALETTETSSSEDIEVVLFSDIKSGNYNNKKVYIKCVLDNVEQDNIKEGIEFDAWIYDKNETFSPKLNCRIWVDDIAEGKDLIRNAATGTTVMFKVGIYQDGSIAFSDMSSVFAVENPVDLAEIRNQYKNTCQELEVNELLRNPEKYKYNDLKYSGKILQVVEQATNSGITKLLLDTGKENGIIQIVYNRHVNESRFLENDNITVYGQFYLLDEYISVLGAKQTVPRVGGVIIDR